MSDDGHSWGEKAKGEYCFNCETFVEGYEHQMCCNAFDCGCQGYPINPCFCSEKCYNEYMKAGTK